MGWFEENGFIGKHQLGTEAQYKCPSTMRYFSAALMFKDHLRMKYSALYLPNNTVYSR
jgi:hypothetical protein